MARVNAFTKICPECDGPMHFEAKRMCRSCFTKGKLESSHVSGDPSNTCSDCGTPIHADATRCKPCNGALMVHQGEGPNPSGLCQCGCGGSAPIAKQSNTKKGYIRNKPIRFIKGHENRKSSVDYVVNPDTGCWEWQRWVTTRGYGGTSRNGKQVPAHRAYYEDRKGPIPKGLVIDHLCRNTICVNPDHLEAVTQSENVKRGIRWPK